MASFLGVFFASDRLPSLRDWEQAATEMGVRLRIMPTELSEHSGMLPVAFDADEINSGFEFQLMTEWERGDDVSDLLRDKDRLAFFRCFGDEYLATVWAAVSFAKASGGVFQDDSGDIHRTLDESLAFARAIPPYGPEFFFEGELVGRFIGTDRPRDPGAYDFEPHLGPGYNRAMELLYEDIWPRCYYDDLGQKIGFVIRGRPYSDVLELGDFETISSR